ncbi:Membrane associated serine protease, rhomboid family [Pseudarcicella hirudinis]|uniref:Membrane associated serine protease, rhomboid family n=1 Tax=Pseudarcicella hirudinis TaxID=1079859 RepID=A0A1I5Q553_9BACT|nr:rhomboid family intramembrane serine protease [Pseudarcicella hirudinis]SFP41494.1 Membrane associated serine protease, rhomboid family [Pseudarcicella hirudinis]
MSLTILLIAATVVISLLAWNNDTLLGKLLMNPFMINRKNEYWRFLTSGFIHADYGHLFFNMLSFYFFGQNIEAVFKEIFGSTGEIYFLILYLGGIILSDVPSYIKNRNNFSYNSLGASGGVSSIIFAGILFFPLDKIYLYGALGIPGIIYALLYVWYSIAMGRRGGDNINHSAHLYGALFGVIFTIAVFPSVVNIFIQQILNWKF